MKIYTIITSGYLAGDLADRPKQTHQVSKLTISAPAVDRYIIIYVF
jgi:hypothetical protein